MIDRLHDLAAQSWNRERGVDSDFLTPEEFTAFTKGAQALAYAEPQVYADDWERKLIHFGQGEPAIDVLKITSTAGEHEILKHSDYLGALMGLGLERRVIGDIVVDGDSAYVYAKSSITEYILQQLTSVSRASVTIEIVEELPDEAKPKRIREEHVVSSLRLDRFIATVFKMSRGKAAEAIEGGLIFIDGRQELKVHYQLEPEERISFRRRGKVQFTEIKGETRKGSLVVVVERSA